MNKVIISAIFCALLSGAVPAVASQTLSVGYAQSKVEDFKNMPGMNLQYRYEWDSPVSVVASFTTLENSEDSNSSFFQRHTSDHVSAKYYSLLAGPAYRLNQRVSVYALAGFSHAAMSRQYHGYDSQGMPQDIQFSETTNALLTALIWGWVTVSDCTFMQICSASFAACLSQLQNTHNAAGPSETRLLATCCAD